MMLVYVTHRYTGDLLPFLFIAAIAGTHVILSAWNRERSRSLRLGAAGLAVLLIWSCFANFALALVYQRQFAPFVTDGNRARFVELQSDVADLFGTGPLPVGVGDRLPHRVPGNNHLFVVGDCDGLYTAVDSKWFGVERTPATGQFELRMTFHHAPKGRVVPIIASGHGDEARRITLSYLGGGRGRFEYGFVGHDTDLGRPFDLDVGTAHTFDVLLDRRLREMHVLLAGRPLIGVVYDSSSDAFTIGRDPDVATRPSAVTVRNLRVSRSLCRTVRARAG